MKKSLIALSVASIAASSAFAQLDLNDKDSKSSSLYASEIDVSGTGVEVTDANGGVITDLGFTVTNAAPRFVRFDLTNGGNFVGAPTLSFEDDMGNPVTAATDPGLQFTLSDGGDTKDFVLFEINATTANPVPNTTRVQLNFAMATPNLGVAGTTSVSYSLFEFGAGGGNGELASSGPKALASFSPAVTVGGSTVTGAASTDNVEAPKDIEVADDSLNFEGGGLNTSIGSIFATNVAAPVPTLVDGKTAASLDQLLTAHTIEIDGDFSWAEEVTAYLDDGTGAPACGTTADLTATINSAMTQAVFAPTPVANVGSVGTTGATEVLTICIEADGKTVINEGTYTGTYKPVAGDDFTVADVPFTLATLGNTGETETLHLTLTPSNQGGTFRNLIRVTNTSATAGRVFFRMINDAGESSPTVTLGEVTGGSDMVGAQASSQQININAIYAAVTAADPTFEFGEAPANKLRTVVTGEFGSMNVQTYTVSTDNTTFATF